jgi:hypothetical protein
MNYASYGAVGGVATVAVATSAGGGREGGTSLTLFNDVSSNDKIIISEAALA